MESWLVSDSESFSDSDDECACVELVLYRF